MSRKAAPPAIIPISAVLFNRCVLVDPGSAESVWRAAPNEVVVRSSASPAIGLKIKRIIISYRQMILRSIFGGTASPTNLVVGGAVTEMERLEELEVDAVED